MDGISNYLIGVNYYDKYRREPQQKVNTMAEQLETNRITKRALRVIEPALEDILFADTGVEPATRRPLLNKVVRYINRASDLNDEKATTHYLSRELMQTARACEGEEEDVAYQLQTIAYALEATMAPRYQSSKPQETPYKTDAA
jgi:hypothetical protein